MMEYLWYDGSPVTEEQFRERFGGFEILPAGDYGAVRLWAITGPTAFQVRVESEEGDPLAGIGVVFSWPDAPELPGSGWDEKGILGTTNDNGEIDFPMGGGAYYFPPAGGPHRTWIFGGNSDYIQGIGMLAFTNHDHFNVVMRVRTEPLGAIPELERAAAASQETEAHLQGALGLLGG